MDNITVFNTLALQYARQADRAHLYQGSNWQYVKPDYVTLSGHFKREIIEYVNSKGETKKARVLPITTATAFRPLCALIIAIECAYSCTKISHSATDTIYTANNQLRALIGYSYALQAQHDRDTLGLDISDLVARLQSHIFSIAGAECQEYIETAQLAIWEAIGKGSTDYEIKRAGLTAVNAYTAKNRHNGRAAADTIPLQDIENTISATDLFSAIENDEIETNVNSIELYKNVLSSCRPSEIRYLKLAVSGYNIVQIAQKCNVSKQAVSKALRNVRGRAIDLFIER